MGSLCDVHSAPLQFTHNIFYVGTEIMQVAVHRNHGVIFTVMEKKNNSIYNTKYNILWSCVARGGMRCIYIYITYFFLFSTHQL